MWHLSPTFSGNRSSLSLLLPSLNAYNIGQLLAIYKHRIAVESFVWGINSFDQWGVEKKERRKTNRRRRSEVERAKLVTDTVERLSNQNMKVLLATLTVILLALVSQVPETKPSPWLDLSLYIQQPNIASSNGQNPVAQSDTGAFIFHRKLTEGPENTSRVVGRAQGFIIPMENFAESAFNIIYLTFHTPEYSGSISVQAKHVSREDTEELTVMGGTGSFAFARGLAVFAQSVSEIVGCRIHLSRQAAA